MWQRKYFSNLEAGSPKCAINSYCTNSALIRWRNCKVQILRTRCSRILVHRYLHFILFQTLIHSKIPTRYHISQDDILKSTLPSLDWNYSRHYQMLRTSMSNFFRILGLYFFKNWKFYNSNPSLICTYVQLLHWPLFVWMIYYLKGRSVTTLMTL